LIFQLSVINHSPSKQI